MNVVLVFDGGNHGSRTKEAYGSYFISAGSKSRLERVTFGTGFTNNEAEYMTLIASLRAILTQAEKKGIAPFDIELVIKGDSNLVKEQVGIPIHIGAGFDPTEWSGWNVNKAHLLPLRDEARRLLLQFYCFDYQHVPRKEIVKILGH